MTDLENLIESNAKAIAALSSNIAEMKRDRDYAYNLMADLTNKIANLTTLQAQHYETTKNLDRRQDQLANQQQQLIDILKTLTDNL
jgi:uncharacterized coiled-coil protein SlyX